ncbi:fungal-specific transcription factor domain-containing protein [Fusarium oxysporum f. sp. albedinis]|nr:fungal-specific transcription factor domain-containing protein [Fusarium oxysporum f. sp. albedinis]
MFHTFQGTEAPLSRAPTDSKPVKGLHACVDCKRRKIRCDGRQPCNQCDSRGSQSRCIYVKHHQRIVPSKRAIESLTKSLDERNSILTRLFPNHGISALLPLSRQELCELLHHPVPGTAAEILQSPACSTPKDSLNLEKIRIQDSQWDEERRERDPLPAEADDVNALSLPLDRQTSYLGISSIKAALEAMLRMRPQLRASLALHQTSNPVKGGDLLPPCQPSQSAVGNPSRKWTKMEQSLVDAYFQRVHIFTPMLNELSFRADYLSGQRHDGPWLSLLNMVLAMGSIVANKSSDSRHCKYYNEAMEHLKLNAFGSSHIEALQALALLGGYYLHYINRPNRANAILGATIRMASALGFHREPAEQDGKNHVSVELRRRTWWSLVCLDTWTTTTLGRPSFGRYGPSIDIQPPKLSIEQEEQDSAQYMGVMPLLENIKFCKIATEIQDMLAVTPFLNPKDRTHLDELLVDWYNDLPILLRSDEECSEPLNLTRCIMRWRYWNLRMLLYRPSLLDGAAKCGSLPTPAQDYAAIETCQELSKITIEDIASRWMSHQMSGWNAVWFLYQAAMIPLLSILWQPESPSVAEWREQVQIILELFEEMEDWSLTARCSRVVVSRIYEASCEFLCRGDKFPPDSGTGLSASLEQDLYLWSGGLDIDDVVNMLDHDWSWNANAGARLGTHEDRLWLCAI